MKVVALSGWKGSGKDEVAKYLVVNSGQWEHCSFASHLKDMVAEQYGIPREWMDLRSYKERPLPEYRLELADDFSRYLYSFMRSELAQVGSYKYWTPRALCILEGSIKRAVNNKYWTSRVIKHIKNAELNGANCNYVISDLRYTSEFAQLKEAFGEDLVVVRVNRFETSTSNDPSERDLDNHKFDVIINNTGTIEELQEQVRTKILNV